MTDNRMYSQRDKNIPVFRGCSFGCVYCSFKRLVQLNKKCPDCAIFKPHSHMEILKRAVSSTKDDNFVTVGLSSDISFMDGGEFYQVLKYCHNHPFTTFLIQSKNPTYFLTWQHIIPRNVILGTTIESNKRDFAPLLYQTDFPHYDYISVAPYTDKRYEAMLKLNCRTAITIEPILDFDIDILEKWILSKHWDFVYIGYASDREEGKKLRLPEPELQKVYALIDRLKRNCYGTEIRIKTLRKAFYEN